MNSTSLILIAVAALATGGIHAAEPNIRVSVQLIELSHPKLTKLLGNTGTKLHPATMALIRDGKAKLIDSSVLTTLPLQKATVESISERIYPVEQEPAHPPSPVGPLIQKMSYLHPISRPPVPADWDIRATGMSFEMEPSYDEPTKTITVRSVRSV